MTKKIAPLILLVIAIPFCCCNCNKGGKATPTPPDSTQAVLFRRYPEPVITPRAGTWYAVDAANASILTPDETQDGKWHLYFRGTAKYKDGAHSGIGLMEQKASDFDPDGGWKPYSPEPVLNYDPHNPDESMSLAGAVALNGPGNKVYLYYKGKSAHNQGVLSGSVSSDGGFTFTKFPDNPMKSYGGATDALYYHHQYYIYYAAIEPGQPLQLYLSVSDTPDHLSTRPVLVIPVGPPGSFDSKSVEGGKIFKVKGDPRWFMVYECSDDHTDYPERFHCAFSTDLVHWTKVQNKKFFFTRGDAGRWDQGAVWTGDVIELNGRLYMYYEGWGKVGPVPDRNKVYFTGGQSQIGVASVSVESFLQWCGS